MADRRTVLLDLQKRLVDALDACEPREVAPLSKELRAVVTELEGLPSVGTGSPVDQVAARRAERQAAARKAAEGQS
jgi:hypothetical protein